MMISKIHLIVIIGLVITNVRSRPRVPPQCPTILGMPCNVHRDCRCLPSLFVCSPRQTCQKATIKLITSRLPCPGIYKRSCMSAADCKCKTHRLKCEDNECVRDKRTFGQINKQQRKMGLKVKVAQQESGC